jgi:perosamine synthetase
LAKKAKHLTTTAKVSADEYIHDHVGYNYRLVNVLAAIGVAQMEQLPEILEQKKKMDAFYRKELTGIGDIQFQKVSDEVDANCWLFTFRTSRMRELLKYLNANGVQSRPFWMPMNQLEMFQNDIYYTHQNVSEDVYQSAISIPSSSGLTDAQLEEVVSKVKTFFSLQNETVASSQKMYS